MSRRMGRLLLGIAAINAGGCAARIEYIPIVEPSRPLFARAPAQVETYLVTPPARQHVDLGLIQVIRGTSDQSINEMLGLLHVAAAEHGCDAIVISMIDARRAKYSPLSVEGSCEMYTDTAAPVAAPQSPLPPAAALPQLRPAVVAEGTPAEVRSAPSKVAPLIARLDAGTQVWVLAVDPGWSFARLLDGRGGYLTNASISFR
jgi:hypothetical protein